MRSLRISYSGARGLVGESMTPDFALRYVSALATYVDGGTVVLARDPRASSDMLHAAAVSACMSAGCAVHDLGVCPTPVAQFHARTHAAIAAGIAISGGHNNSDWNGLMPFRSDGTLFNAYDGAELLDVFHSQEFRRVAWNEMGVLTHVSDFWDAYVEALAACVDTKAIAALRPTVVVDPCNGAAAPWAARLLERLGCTVVAINNEPTGVFPHDPEPRPRNSRQVAALIRPLKAHIGFSLNSDGTRVSVISDSAETVTEEYTAPLVADHCLERTPGATIVANVCTTRTMDEVVARHGGRMVKTSVGQSAVVGAMAEEGAILACEGSGGIAYPAFQPVFDAGMAMALILESLAVHGLTCDGLLARLPRYHLVKKTVSCRPDRQYAAVEAVREAYAGEAALDATDGIRVDWEDGWVHVRASVTEPVVRIISESRTQIRAAQRADHALHLIHRTL